MLLKSENSTVKLRRWMPSARSARIRLSLVRWPEITTSPRRRPMPWIWMSHLTSHLRSGSSESPMIAIRFCALGHLRWYSKFATRAPFLPNPPVARMSPPIVS